MKVIILAGGLGSRLSEYTENIPKPMVTVGGKPILWHIMNRYAKYGFTDFYLALGYKAEVIKEYFLNYRNLNSDFTINLSTGSIYSYQENKNDWKVTLIDTGKETMTGGRVKRMQSFIENETFLLTYGDGVADINIDELIKFHKSHGKMVTVSAVRPRARFGELNIDKGLVSSFQEKPQTKEERIQEIKLWYSEVQKIGMQNCETKKRVKYDSFDLESEKIPFDQVVKTCKLDDHYELIRGEFGGYEWGQQLSIYKKDGKIFFVLVEGASEGWSYTKRYYCDRDENLIQLLENEADGGEEVKGPGKETPLDPAKPRIQENIVEYLTDVNFVITGK
jgi:glucose-1-phosphate cytidylyltransferase